MSSTIGPTSFANCVRTSLSIFTRCFAGACTLRRHAQNFLWTILLDITEEFYRHSATPFGMVSRVSKKRLEIFSKEELSILADNHTRDKQGLITLLYNRNFPLKALQSKHLRRICDHEKLVYDKHADAPTLINLLMTNRGYHVRFFAKLLTGVICKSITAPEHYQSRERRRQ